LSRNLPEVIAIYADVLRRPRLTDEAFGPCRDLVQQALDGLEDQPMQKCNVLLRENFYPYPLGRNPLGTKDTLSALDSHRLRTHVQAHLTPANTLLAVAGQFDWGQLVETVGTHLGDWQGGQPAQVATRAPLGGVGHIEKPSAQVQITLAYPAATVNHATYYWCRLAQTVLSGGMSSRLFTEVREKRGLVYAIAAQYHSLKEHAGIFVYAGTTPEHVQETLEVTVEVLRGLSDGIDEEELARARVQLRSALVMQGESTSARADALAGDYYHLGRLRHLEEISAAIEGVRRDQVAQYARMFPAERFTALTIGPKQPDTALLG
jgi:predicted Zn-dependent peptidase